MQTFQKPLSEEEETYYLQLYGKAEEPASSEARRILIEHNLRLVAHIAKKYQNVEENMEDLISIGTIGLIKAVETFDGTKGSRLATYAARCIDNELLMMLRSRRKTAKEVSIYEPVSTDREGNEINLLDIIVSEPKDVVQDMMTEEYLQKLSVLLKQVLTEREREIIIRRYGLVTGREMTQRELGLLLGISRSYVSRIEKKALKKLRDALQ